MSSSVNLPVDKMQIFDYFLSQEQHRKIVKRKQKINEDEVPRKSDVASHFYEDKESWQRKFSHHKKNTLKQKTDNTPIHYNFN